MQVDRRAYELRDSTNDPSLSHSDLGHYSVEDEEHSVLEDDSDGEGHEADDYMDEDDGSSSLSIPNESIDFDLVYSLHSFAATVEGQANVMKGDSLFLMDDSNSYWWLVRVLKTQEVGYIPAENIETPFERLARLNKHRNVDLASATQAELQEDLHASQNRQRINLTTRQGQPPSGNIQDPQSRSPRGVAFTPTLSVHRYPPAVWNEDEIEEDVEWDDGEYEDEDPDLADEQEQQRRAEMAAAGTLPLLDPDDGMGWDDSVAETMQQTRQLDLQSQLRAPPPGNGYVVEQQLQLQQQILQQQQQQKLALSQQQQQLQQQQLQQQQQQQQQQLQQQADSAASAQQQALAKIAASRDRVVTPNQDSSPTPSTTKFIDPLEATETRKLTTTPTLLREDQDTYSGRGKVSPSAVATTQPDERTRPREEEDSSEDAARKKHKGKEKSGSVSSITSSKSVASTGKATDDSQRDSPEKKDKKKKGVFSGLFSRKKDKSKDKSSSSDVEARTSDDSSRPSSRPSITGTDLTSSPTAISTVQQQPQVQQPQVQSSTTYSPADPKRNVQVQQPQQQPQQQAQAQATLSQVSQHASQLRQRDQQQQALYQQYLNRSPATPPEAQPSYGLQSVSAIMASTSLNSSASSSGLGPPAARPRPGSLILSPAAVDGHVHELSVIRVFAGKKIQTEATFKTVLLNSSTTSSELVKQAIQRFRLDQGDDFSDYYLTIKQVEGSSAVLGPDENPLRVFETLVERSLELPKVKRSSVGSISSVASNLSMHPAIKKLSMNDFTDDSAVKFYLNRKSDDESSESLGESDAGHADSLQGDRSSDSRSRSKYLAVATGNNSVTPERFSSPSYRFPVQLVIHPEDLPDDMVFDPTTEAVVFKHTLRDRSPRGGPSGVSQTKRRKVFVFPKNVTVAEVIELGLERFGIQEGVVDGGDEVEDKLTKRRSFTRVRYVLMAQVSGNPERELAPSSRVIDAFPRPPTNRLTDRRSAEKRRSVDSAMLLGSLDDVHPDDPTFILRRAVSYRHASRHRTSAPLDEIALQQFHLHRESALSQSSAGSDATVSAAEDGKHQGPSRQEIIAAQRAATRANQKAILSAQTNSVRGVDILLPGNVMLRSSRYETDDRMRYSYVEPDGETYDISDIVEEEWREGEAPDGNGDGKDLLQGVLGLDPNRDALGDRLDRVLNKVKVGRPPALGVSSPRDSRDSMRSATSEYSEDSRAGAAAAATAAAMGVSTARLGARSNTPTMSGGAAARLGASSPVLSSRPGAAAAAGAGQVQPRSRTSTPTSNHRVATDRRQGPGSNITPEVSPSHGGSGSYSTPTPSGTRRKRGLTSIPKDEFGVAHMLAIIGYSGRLPTTTTAGNTSATASVASPPPLDPIERLLFGQPIDRASLHPQIREMYAGAFKRLEDMDKTLDDCLQQTINGAK